METRHKFQSLEYSIASKETNMTHSNEVPKYWHVRKLSMFFQVHTTLVQNISDLGKSLFLDIWIQNIDLLQF